MKKYLILLSFILTYVLCYAILIPEEVEYVRAYKLFMPDKRGIYHEVNDTDIDISYVVDYNRGVSRWSGYTAPNVEEIIYNKKTKKLYVATDVAVCEVSLNETGDKRIKKIKTLLQTKNDKDVTPLVERYKGNLTSRYTAYNNQREQFLQDSISKAIQDSLENVRRIREQFVADSLAHVKKLKDYRLAHDEYQNRLKSFIKCSDCDKTLKDCEYLFGIANDTAIFCSNENLGINFVDSYFKYHYAPLDKILKEENQSYYKQSKPQCDFADHIEAYQDSLAFNVEDTPVADLFEYGNNSNLKDFLNSVAKVAPYGFIADWGWDNPYGFVNFNVEYVNTNKKTIKYITYYWTVKNDVGDVRGSGYFKGTGPVETWNSGSWDWDYSHYYVAGDASTMSINKIVISYMDGTTKTLNKNQIVFN